MNIQYPRRLAHRGALIDQAPGDIDLLGGQLWRPAESHASRSGRVAAGAGALMDERALETRAYPISIGAILSQISLQNASFSRQIFAMAKPQGFPWWLRLSQNLQVLRRSRRCAGIG
jgi:hypothetical protein